MGIRTAFFLFLSLPLFSSPALAQSADSRTLQSILEELHKLRQELQATSATAQRSQILLLRIRLQMDTVERLNQRLEQAHLRTDRARNELNHFLDEKKRDEGSLDQAQDSVKRKAIEDELAGIESRLEFIKDNLPDAEAKEAALTNDLRNEQSKLAELREQLDRLDKQLASELPAQTPR